MLYGRSSDSANINPRRPRGGGWCHPPQTVFPELLENGGAQRRRFLAMLPYIQGGPDDVLKIFRSGQVTDLWRHFSTLCTVQND